MRELLGARARTSEMTRILGAERRGSAGFTITTEACVQ